VKLFNTSLVATAFTLLASGSVMADNSSMVNKTKDSFDNTTQKVETSIDKGVKDVSQYSDDSAITAKVKKAFMENKSISSHDISVKTEKGVVTLTGFVDSNDKQVLAVKLAKEVKGVQSVNDKLNIKGAKDETVKGYTDDASITAGVKAKLLTTDDVPSMSISVETVNGIVQLTGTVEKRSQSEAAEAAAKMVENVKSVKNDLVVKP
jgi:hyperosmotically inducible protein